MTKNLSRLVVLCALAVLADCAGGNSSADLSPAAPPQAEAPPDPAPPPAPATKQAARPSPAGRNTSAPPPPAPPPAAPQAASTPEEIKGQCWMKYENDKKIKNIDARLAAVEKCIADTSRGQPPAR